MYLYNEGHTFIKLDAGMTEVLRPSLYGRDAQPALVIGHDTMYLNVIVRRYNPTALCNTAGTGTLWYCGKTLVDQSQDPVVAHPCSTARNTLW